jgi:integrase
VKLSTAATSAIVRWERERTRAFGTPAGDVPLFITLGRRRTDGTYTRVGRRCGQAVLAAILKRLGAAAELPDELRHPHALRHTCATELLRTDGVNVAVEGPRSSDTHPSRRRRSTSPATRTAKSRPCSVASGAGRSCRTTVE